jgi:hypothetical protein
MVLNDVVTDDDGVAYLSNSFDGQIIRAYDPLSEITTAETINLPSFRGPEFSFELNGMEPPPPELEPEHHDGALFIAHYSDASSEGRAGMYRSTE